MVMIAAAVAGVMPSVVRASDYFQNGEFVISTGGATALGAFTRMNNNSGTGTAAPTAATLNRGPLAVGTSFTLGSTAYSVPLSGVRYYGQGTYGVPDTSIGEPANGVDRARYYYLESGSVEGVLTLVDSNGLRTSAPGTVFPPNDPAANLGLWINGNRYTAPNSTGEFSSGRGVGRNYPTPATFNHNSQNWAGHPPTRIAWTDVRFEEAFAVAGTANFARRPTQPGYGKGNGKIGDTNFQEYRDDASLIGGTNPATTRLRNEQLAIIPFNLVASPGTGLSKLTKEEARWMQAVGRLPNGANFNSVTRYIGSGTRSQGANNLLLDPSFGGGERDRRALSNHTSITVDGVTGLPVPIKIGDEADPLLSLTGSTTQDRNENRTGPRIKFSDKISGSTGVRPTVASSRMAMGILSSGDSRSSDGDARAASFSTASNPIRALAIDWGNGHGFTQATAENVTEGRYEMWSASVAVTVAPYANPTANDVGANAYRPIAGDLNDQNIGGPTSASQPGLHRKFLDNITKSVATLNTGTAAITPADFVISASFIPPQIMGVQKEFDGDTPSTRTRSNVDPDGPGPAQSEQVLWEQLVQNSGGFLRNQLNWANPSTYVGGLSAGAVKYRIFASANNSGAATPNREITINARTNLAGDFNGDEVRDLADVPALAMAYAAPTAYLATPVSGHPNGRNYNGIAVNSTSVGTNASAADGLIVLSDLNSNGNVTVDANNSTFATQLVERADVRYFLYGAAVDTTGFSGAAAKREDGVRLGTMKKNAAIAAFNNELNLLATQGVITTAQAEALKFKPHDANGDEVENFYDAKLVWLAQGKSVTNLQDQLDFMIHGKKLINSQVVVGGTQYATTNMISLVDVEMTDDGVINNTDFDLVQAKVLGDFDWSGGVNNQDIAGFVQALTNPAAYVAQFEEVDVADLFILGDFTGDNVFNNQDIAGFVSALTGSRPVAEWSADPTFAPLLALVPEPSSLGLLGLGGLALVRRRRSA
jgi:hypothetical protein